MQQRMPNLFEKILLVVGIVAIITGYALIHRQVAAESYALSWGMLTVAFLWLILIAAVILTATLENVKEELKIVVENQVDELRLLREEVKLLRHETTARKK